MAKQATVAAEDGVVVAPERTVATKPKFNVRINLAWCKGCGICIAFCPKGILVEEGLEKKARVTDESLCIDCKMCEVHCPDFAIEVFRSDDT